VARHRQRLDLAQRERARALDVVLLVEVAKRALCLPGLGAQARRRGLRAPERGVGEGQTAQQVVPVAVRAQQARQRPAGLLEDRRERVELLREDRRVDDEALARGRRRAGRLADVGQRAMDDRAGRLPDRAADDDDVSVDADGLQRDPS
jgi:hypothetical protein